MTKNLCSGEGGAILTNDEKLAQKCYAFHNNSRPRATAGYNFSYLGGRGANLRMTEFQGALLTAQMTRLEEQSNTRQQNAQYLTGMLREIPGITPARMYDGCTRNAYHLYMFRYDPQQFAGLPREKFLAALGAEGIPCSGGYSPLNKESLIKEALHSRGYRKIYSQAELDRWEERNQCPVNDRLCQRGGLVHPEHVSGPARRHGPDRRGGAQDSRPRRGAGQGLIRALSLQRLPVRPTVSELVLFEEIIEHERSHDASWPVASVAWRCQLPSSAAAAAADNPPS